MKDKSSLFPWLIIGVGIFYSLYLLTQIPEGVYFSGDGGLKSLLAQQLSKGNLHIDLISPSENWVPTLWQQGFYPYKEPFVYHLEGRYYLTFPFTFSLVTAPFYALFGFRGLYIVPLLATWMIWVISYLACRRLKFNYWWTSLALLILIFASNLTLYSAMYWEHTLAVVLCFAGMAMWLIPKETSGLSRQGAMVSGCLIGLSVWVRSEFLAMVATIAILIYGIIFLNIIINKSKNFSEKINLRSMSYLTKNNPLLFLSMLGTVGIFFVINKIIYDHFLGIHAMQIVEGFSLARRLSEACANFQELGLKFFDFFPVAWFAVLYLFLFLFQQARKKIELKYIILGLLIISALFGCYLLFFSGMSGVKLFVKHWGISLLISLIWIYLLRDIEIKFKLNIFLIYLMTLLFIIGVSLLVVSGENQIEVGGKQWGKRYLLILLPWISFLVIEEAKLLQETLRPLAKYSSIFMLSLLLLLGVYKNTYIGTQFFLETHQKSYPAIQALQTNPNRIIVVSHQYAAQSLEAPLKDQKWWFRAEESKDLSKLGAALLNQNQNKFIYVCYPYSSCKPPKDTPEHLNFNQGKQHFQIKLSPLGNFGIYPIYEGEIIQQI